MDSIVKSYKGLRDWELQRLAERGYPEAIAETQWRACRVNDFGCLNCLYASCECKSGSLYKPKGKDSCESYVYFD